MVGIQIYKMRYTITMIKALYLHVPFCKSICHYCDFNRSVYQKEIVDKWLEAIKRDIIKKDINTSLQTIYIGGGTPTALSLEQLEQLLILLKPYTSVVNEYTIESNLESITSEKLALLKRYGINRISLGVQSYNDTLLAYMNRKHTAKEIPKKIELVHKYIENISVDLIYGFQNQTIEIWKHTLQQVLRDPYIQHISMYSLTIEAGSIFYKRGIEVIENQKEAQMYEIGKELLEASGFHQYEIANYARQGKESLHNQVYWHYEDFYGIGVGASGKEEHQRYSITGSVNEYILNTYTLEKEELTRKDEIIEFIMMNFRLIKGFDIQRFERLFHLSFFKLFTNTITTIQEKGYVKSIHTYLTLNNQGILLLHDILVLFMEELDEREDFITQSCL